MEIHLDPIDHTYMLSTVAHGTLVLDEDDNPHMAISVRDLYGRGCTPDVLAAMISAQIGYLIDRAEELAEMYPTLDVMEIVSARIQAHLDKKT